MEGIVEVSKALCIVGPLPPPRHGVSAINESMMLLARENGFVVTSFDTAPSSLDRSLRVRLSRLGRIILAILGAYRFAKQHPYAVVYLSLSGGWGLVYESLIARCAKMAGARIVVHHHSFRYLDNPFWPMSLLVRSAGVGAIHVVLGDTMAKMLRVRYPKARTILIASNAQYIQGESRPSTQLRRVGYLSNLSKEKGMDDVLATARSSRGLPIEFIVAGPFVNSADEAGYRQQMNDLPNIRYVGPLHGERKAAFYRDIDAFIFPTRYSHEAEPLVVLEALSYGRPVIAFDRGCIPSILTEGGIVIDREGDLPILAIDIFRRWLEDEDSFRKISKDAARQFGLLRNQSLSAREELLKRFVAA